MQAKRAVMKTSKLLLANEYAPMQQNSVMAGNSSL
jgi:hypothetical protein